MTLDAGHPLTSLLLQSMGGSRVQINKVHKTRFASKSSRQEHRIPIKDKSRGAKPDKNAFKSARAARIQRSKMLRDQKRAALLKEKRALSGSSSSPRVIVLFGLSSSVNLDMLSKDLLMLLSGDKSGPYPATVASQTYKIRTTVVRTLIPDTSKQEPLVVENIPDPLAGEQTWPTEADMAEADAKYTGRKLKRRKLPPGTSDYQAAWIVEDTDDELSDGSVEEGYGMVLDGPKDHSLPEGSEQSDNEDANNMESLDEETEADTEMVDDDNLTREQVEAEIKKLKDASGLDEEFPDEVDTPLDVPAKKRFARYRGLKSFRTSSWDPQESLPPEYARVFNFDNFARTQNHVLAKVQEIDQEHKDGSAQVGSFVRIHVKEVPADVASKLFHLSHRLPVVVCGLLQHESKMSVLHFSLKKHDSYDAPIKSKETFTFHVGFRQFVARPLFSSDNINSDKNKMERFLHPGRFAIASVYAPINFPPMPLVVLKNNHGDAPAVVALGSLRSVDPYRIILKKIILTGYPLRVSKKKATVRYMFHHPEDVRWFKPVELYTKCGRRGRIKDSVGTHGPMKCVFNGVIQQHDTVCMSLYKRAYPKWPDQLFPLQ